ncbi:MAG: hypothetical protein FWF53_06905 [Candidatus Azobacteroides sp.]|nr:hypothetical protein [Candidatus Azobacteroides sp.]
METVSKQAQAEENYYIAAIMKAMREFIQDECQGHFISSDERLMNKIEAARILFPEDRQKLRNMTLTV